jgi:glyoxylase-like metal-dependent hydrolase (beta-lactamase superfamily II)/8-oxo-dGTP pyrophosphatase MutT (NUDIX family)
MPEPSISDPPQAAAAAVRPAATLVVVRDGADGIEALLLRRAERGDQNSGAWVFPGGLVDAGDRASHGCCTGLDDAEASRRLGVPDGGLDYAIAAARECFEESGLLFAIDAQGRPADAADAAIQRWRTPLHRGERALHELCAQAGLRIDAGRLVYLSHWLTPIGRAKRFDTRFFIARAPEGQAAAADGHEVTEHRWLRTAEALAPANAYKLMTPTHKTLELIGGFASVAALLDWASAPRDVPLVMPHMGRGRDGARPVMPDEPAWAELARIDPEGRGDGCYDIRPGVAVRLSECVLRVTADNGSAMTGPGTNTYLVRADRDEWAAIDPGPADAAHVEAILAAAPGPITRIFATHTHLDHSPACALLKARTGASVAGRIAEHPQWQDADFVPDTQLAGGERIVLGAGSTLRVIHTPGHASNHLCYLLEEEKTLFTGDHVMQLSTVVINPPDGDMAVYLASLRRLLDEDLDWLAPGHGFLMREPRRAIEAILAHRLRREAKVVEALQALGPSSTDALLARVYVDVPARMHPMALRSLTAHLLKLRDEGRALAQDGRWALRPN